MFGIHDLGVFLMACLAVNLTPGPDTLYILGRTMAQGRRAGIASVLGISSGCLFHTIAAACGLSVLLAASASALFAVKLIGAVYLIYLGVRMLISRTELSASTTGLAPASPWLVYRQGMLTNVLNPKVALFFLAFVPQFIAADSPDKFVAFLALGACFVMTGTLWCLCLVWLASPIGDHLRRKPASASIVNRVTGALLVLLGLRLAVAR
jgi:threonine/homoserine/homoserine lactone efflux protein